jgi:hypothetical protein
MTDDPSGPMTRRSWKSIVLVTAGILTGMAVMLLLRLPRANPIPQQPPNQQPTVSRAPQIEPIDPRAIREKAWSRIQPRLTKADEEAAAEIGQATSEIDRFFNMSKQGARPLAKEMLSFRGEWASIKSGLFRLWPKVPLGEQDADVKRMNDKFAEYVFKPDDAKREIEGGIAGYVQRLNAIENQLLVHIRADLSDKDLPALQIIAALGSDDSLRKEYDRLVSDVTASLSGQLAFLGRRELAIFVGSEIATKIVFHVASAIGIRVGIVSLGAASSWATLGAGLVVAIALEFIIDEVEKLLGHDPETAVANKIEEALERMRVTFVEGDPEAVEVYHRLRELERENGSEKAHRIFRDAADSIERSGNLGIRFDLEHVHEARKKLRREALKRLIAGKENVL